VIALFSMIVLPRAMSLGPSLDEGFMEKSCLYPQSQQQAQCGWVYMYEVRVNNKITMTKACYHDWKARLFKRRRSPEQAHGGKDLHEALPTRVRRDPYPSTHSSLAVQAQVKREIQEEEHHLNTGLSALHYIPHSKWTEPQKKAHMKSCQVILSTSLVSVQQEAAIQGKSSSTELTAKQLKPEGIKPLKEFSTMTKQKTTKAGKSLASVSHSAIKEKAAEKRKAKALLSATLSMARIT
jgi:hypothetical protein